jgi:competence protein ComFC
VCRECGVPIDSVCGDGDSDGDGPGELFEDVCLGCRSEKFHFDRARSFARYQGSLVRAIVLLKFEELEPLAEWFADRLAEVVRQNGTALKADLLVQVPLQRPGGASVASTGRKCCQNGLRGGLDCRIRAYSWLGKRPRPDKHILTSNERWEAVRGAFATCPGSQVDKRRVLLVDDVMTTGATPDA